MEGYLIEIWLNGNKVSSYVGYPEDMLASTNTSLADWFAETAKTKKWEAFCQTFDSCRCRSGVFTNLPVTIRISNRKEHDNI